MTRRCIETWRYCPVRCSLLDGRSVAMPFEVLADLFLTVNCKTIFTEYCTVLLAFGFTGLLLLVTDDSSLIADKTKTSFISSQIEIQIYGCES